MKCLRIYATQDGESHIGEVDVALPSTDLFADRPPVQLSSAYPASKVQIVSIPAGVKDTGWHTAPGRILTMWLNGGTEFETSDGGIGRLSAGGLLLAEDTHGKGHLTRLPENGQQIVMIFMPDGIS